MPKDYGDVVSEDGDQIPHDAELDDIPAAQPRMNGSASHTSATETAPPEDDQDDDESEDEGEEYQVENILKHSRKKGELLFFIKWLGYPDDQNTWEPEENLLPSSRGILQEYFDTHGGEAQVKGGSVKKTKSTTSLRDDSARSAKRQKIHEDEDDDSWTPKTTDWTAHVDKVDTIERDQTGQLQVYLRFHNGKRTKVSMDRIKKHCPVPMLEFYENHLKFKLETRDDTPSDPVLTDDS